MPNNEKNNIIEFDTLSSEERALAEKILAQLSTSGESCLYDNLLYADYREKPVDIETFLTNDYYLGAAWKDKQGNSKLYPFWLKQLKILFPDNIQTSVNNFIESGARGLGKSEIAIATMCYLMHRVMCLRDANEHYHLKITEKICFAFMNITKTLSENIGISKFQHTIQMSPWFMQHGKMTKLNNEPYWVPPDPIEIIVGSQPSHVIGQPIFAAFFDEISFIRNQDIDRQKQIALDMIDTAIGGMKTRFIHKGMNPTLLILASSKRSEKSFLEEHMKKKLRSEGENVLIVDEPVWKVKPEGTYSDKTFFVALGNKFLQSKVIENSNDVETCKLQGYKIIEVPIDFLANFTDDIDRALCDYAGVSSSEISKYIRGLAYKEVINNNLKNPFEKEVLEVGNGPDDNTQYYDFFDINKVSSEAKSKPLYIHLDMSISGDKTGIAGVYIKGKKPSTNENNQSKDMFFTVAFGVSIKAPKGRQISFEKNRNFIYWLKEKGFNIKGISTDTFQSYDTGQTLQQKGYNYSQISVDRVNTDHICIPYQYFQSTIYEKRIEIPYIKSLQDQVIDLERNINTGKVDHPQGGCFTGDTLVALVDGRHVSFTTLVKEYEQGKVNYVYSYNHKTGLFEIKPIKKAWLTHKNAQLVQVTLSNREVIRCTPNHRFMLQDGTYKEASTLLVTDKLMKVKSDCTILSVSELDYTEDVYDIEVQDNHNFLLSAGIFVHNSKDLSDAVCGALFNASQHAEEFAYDYGETLDSIIENNTVIDEKQQLIVDFEQALKETYKTKNNENDSQFRDFGNGPAEEYTPAYLSQGIILW